MKKLNILNIYQLNIFQMLNFMLKTKLQLTPKLFLTKFHTIKHKYPTNYANNNYSVPKHQLKTSKYCISIRGPTLWNKFLTNEAKTITSIPLFQKTIRNQLINYENEISLF